MVDGATFAGWILATIAVAGIYGAVTNESWFSVLARTVDPSRAPVPVDPHTPIKGHGGSGYVISHG